MRMKVTDFILLYYYFIICEIFNSFCAGVGGSQALVGAVLGAKAAAQLLTAPTAARAVALRGPVPVLRAATALLATAAAGGQQMSYHFF